MSGRVVHKVEKGDDRSKVRCTTYQMRNPFTQFADCAASELDVHCYMQHAYAADLCAEGDRVLDVCCGRGLMIPFLRYRVRKPSLYCGVDVAPGNARWTRGEDPRGGGRSKGDWGFPCVFVQSFSSEMALPVRDACGPEPFKLVVFTSAIEHMQPADQQATLRQARQLCGPGAAMYLTGPVSDGRESGYDTQFDAHVYEAPQAELERWLAESGWRVGRKSGLCTKVSDVKARLSGAELSAALELLEDVPREFGLVMAAQRWPECATEVAYVCEAI